MPKQSEHRNKYKENKQILETVLDVRNKEHCNWITTIAFYTALHIIEHEFAKENIDNKTHSERENRMQDSDKFSNKILSMFKQMSSNSKIARYKAENVSPTIANQMLIYLQKIEEEYGFSK